VKTEITVVRNGNGAPVGFKARGHSGDQAAGQNVTCASITVIFEYLSELSEGLPSEGVQFRQDPETTQWSIVFDREGLSDREAFMTDRLVEAGLSLFEKIQERDPESCRIVDPGPS
jgi:uncharacterized protein YsxB (DUF464 family)